jgi:hypothetical protein
MAVLNLRGRVLEVDCGAHADVGRAANWVLSIACLASSKLTAYWSPTTSPSKWPPTPAWRGYRLKRSSLLYTFQPALLVAALGKAGPEEILAVEVL